MDSAATPNKFIGRAKEFDALISFFAGNEAHPGGSATAIVWGPSGVGKTALVDACLDQLLGLQERFFWFKSKAGHSPADPVAFARSLVESARSNHVSLGIQIPGLLRDFLCFSRANAPPGIEKASSLEDGQGPDSSVNSDDRPLPSPGEVAVALTKGLLRVLSHGSGFKPGQESACPPRLVFIIDHWDPLSLEVNAFLLELQDALAAQKDALTARFVLVSEASPRQSGTVVFGGMAGRSSLVIGLAPLTWQETIDYLRQAGIQSELFAALYSETGGMPSKLKDKVSVLTGATTAPPDEGLDNLWAQLNPAEADWLATAAYLDRCCPEGLAIVGGLESGLKGFRWLSRSSCARLVQRADGFVELEGAARRRIREWVSRQFPEKHRLLEHRSEVHQQLVRLIPDAGHRERLRMLAPFNHFRRDLLDQLYPDKSADLWRFVEENPAYFTPTESHRILVETLKPLLQDYAFWLAPSEFERMKRLITEAWSQQREAMITEIARLESELAKNEQERQAVCAQIQNASQSIARQAGLAPPVASLDPAPITRVLRPRPLKTALGIQAIGVVCTYTGMLFFHSAREMAIAYIGLGIYLFIWGIYLSCCGRAVSTLGGRTEASVHLDRYMAEQQRCQEGDLNLLRLQKINLENRQNSLFAQYARATRMLSDCYRRLNEPFI
ncbi:MAG TPA: ATP-binding protein [Candidatus Paceibacterota bacterium]|nr:ATP-binding protein [Verrucomicrobiota bacterium]HRY47549.1 ATP-binding protein [Candidatus Paceibacterota bacterium]